MKNILYIALVIFLLFPSPCFAEGEDAGLDIVFAVDTSGSMNTNDPEGFVREFIDLFASVSDGVRVGIAGYSAGISVSLPPCDPSSEEGGAALSSALLSLVPSGNTDVGLGLSEAKRLLDEADGGNAKAIFLFSDGETYVSRGGRGGEASARDTENVLAWAKDTGARVYTAAIGNHDGSKELLSRLASETGGAFYENPERGGFAKILEDILCPVMKSPLSRLAELEGTVGPQEITLSVPHGEAGSVSLIFVSDAPIAGLLAERSGLSEAVRFSGGNRSAAVSIKLPQAGDYSIKFTAAAHTKAYTLYSAFGLRSEISVEETEDGAASARLAAYRGKTVISDKAFYESLNASIFFIGNDGVRDKGAALAEENGVFAEYRAEAPFEVRAEASFSSPAYTDEVLGNGLRLFVEEKKDEFPWALVFAGGTIVLLVIFIGMLLFRKKTPVPILKTEKYAYAGKLAGYVIKTETGAEYPPFYFIFSGLYSSEPLSLKSILSFALDDDLGADEAAKIVFSPGPGHSLVFCHNTSQTIMLGPLVTAAGESYIMDYGAKLFLMLQSGRIELELHFKQTGPKETATYAPSE
jgi:hypothetical protein